MINKFGEFLYLLRKQKNLTQNDLAYKLDITNKAISKWETGESFPETGQLVPLSKILGVTVDELLNGEFASGGNTSEVEFKTEKIGDAGGFSSLNYNEDIAAEIIKKNTPIPISYTVVTTVSMAIIFIAVTFMITMLTLNFSYRIIMSIFFILVAIAVALLTYINMIRDYKIKAILNKTNYEPLKTFSLLTALGVMLCILSPIALIAPSDSSSFYPFFIALFFCIIFTAVLIFIATSLYYHNFSIKNNFKKFDKQNLSQETFDEQKLTQEMLLQKSSPVLDAVCGAVMLLSTATFLFCGFVFSLWHPAWVAFPIGGILCAIISSFKHLKKPNNKM